MKLVTAISMLVCICGCGDDAVTGPLDGGGGADAASDGGGSDGGGSCPRLPGPADGVRKVVVAHPYDANSAPSNRYEVLELSATGALTATGTSFELGRAPFGEIAFTPDGQVGIVAQDDGSLGVFRFDEAGAPVVVHAGFGGSFYAAHVVMDRAGARAYVVDTNWRENGGGVYVVRIGCDGALTDEGLLVASKLPAALAFTPDGTHALLAATDVLASPAGHDAHLLAWGAGAPALLAGADAFGDDEAIIGGAALTHDGRYFLIGDNQGISKSPPNRVAVVELVGETLVPRQVVTPLLDPFAIVPSPFDDQVLVVSGFGDAIFALAYTPGATPPLGSPAELAYTGAGPQLPGNAVMVGRGTLTGRVLIAENQGVRQVQFVDGAAPMDLGLTTTGSGVAAITGALGVQP
jgi:hypothetical protein